MIDSHCHLTDPRLLSQLDDVLKRASDAGVTRVVTIGCDPEDNQAAIDVCRTHSNVRCAVGLHPNYCKDIDESEIPKLRDVQADQHVVAIGETGLDYHYESDRARQRRFFVAQMELAHSVGKPVVIHCREAIDDTLAIMKDFPKVPAVFHCFTGTLAEGERVLAAGYLIGFGGVVTFKKSDDLRQLAARAPEAQILVETDAPYLTPEPMRKVKTNEPVFTIHTAAAVAWERGTSLAEIDRISTANARAFYRWPEPA